MWDDDDERTLAQALAGDESSLATLLTRYDPRLRQRLRKRIARRYQAAFDPQDVLQVTYLEVFLQLGRFRPNGSRSFLAWLIRIAENNLRDAVKELDRDKRPPRKKQVALNGEDDSYTMLLATFAGTETSPSVRFGRAETKELIEKALGRLPPDYETVIRLCDLQNQTVAQAAATMGRSVPAVQMLKARARDHLGDLLGNRSAFF